MEGSGAVLHPVHLGENEKIVRFIAIVSLEHKGYCITGVAEGEVERGGGAKFVSWWAGNHLLGGVQFDGIISFGGTLVAAQLVHCQNHDIW